MRAIHIDSVVVAEGRQRKFFDQGKLNELADSIQARGLLHPIILRQVGKEYHLVAGERRLRAMQQIYSLGGTFAHDGAGMIDGMVPYTLITDLDPLAAEEAELEENVQRENLSWQEHTQAVARLMNLRQAQAALAGAPLPTVAALSQEITGTNEGSGYATTRKELLIAKHLDKPEVAQAKTLDEAWKILQKSEQKDRRQQLGETVGRSFTADLHKAFNEDSFSWIKQCQSGLFDVILTDPPYGMGADEFGDSGTGRSMEHGYKDDAALLDRIVAHFPAEMYRVAKEQAHLYWFCDPDKFFLIRNALAAAGWSAFRTPLIWFKRSGMRAPWPLMGPQRKYEMIVYAVKGKRPVTKMAGDLLDFPSDPSTGHMAQKPVALYQELLSRSCEPGNLVLDPFAGSGPIFPAAHALKCRAMGVEMDTASYAIMIERINALKEGA